MRTLVTAMALGAMALCLVAHAQAGDVTTSRNPVGGPGSCSSEGFNDPGLLADGETVASATYHYYLDTGAGTLTLVIENTSPVVIGVANPVLTELFFNAPLEITDMELVSQSGSGGARPDFGFTFDADIFNPPHINAPAGFGSFSGALITNNGVSGGIANPLADTIGGPVGATALSPVTFVFDLTGDLTNLTSNDFSLTPSVTPPGDKPSNAVGHFQAGGPQSTSAYITNAVEDCLLLFSVREGDDTLVGPAPYFHPFDIQVQDPIFYAASFLSPPQIPLPFDFSARPIIDASGLMPGGSPVNLIDPRLGQLFMRVRAQIVMWNPQLFPGQPEQWTQGADISVWSSGQLTVQPFGDSHGMALNPQLRFTADGRPYLWFPFTMGEF